MPGAHELHTLVPEELALVPGEQLRHVSTLDSPRTGLALPNGHRRHALLFVALSSGLYVPAGQGSKVMLALAAPMVAQ